MESIQLTPDSAAQCTKSALLNPETPFQCVKSSSLVIEVKFQENPFFYKPAWVMAASFTIHVIFCDLSQMMWHLWQFYQHRIVTISGQKPKDRTRPDNLYSRKNLHLKEKAQDYCLTQVRNPVVKHGQQAWSLIKETNYRDKWPSPAKSLRTVLM